jgi:epoxyqueuosine reductase
MSNPDHQRFLSEWIKTRALELGFSACGISKAEHLEKDDDRLRNWLLNGYQGGMSYMERNLEKRTDPRLLVDGAKSVITVLLNYYPAELLPEENNYKIARYAYGWDYHDVIKDKLRELVEDIKLEIGNRKSEIGNLSARAFVDSAPVLDKAWAERAGLGWIGKNTCLIHPKLGSFLFVGEIITNLELEYDTGRVNDLCGGCTRCLDACPTGALVGARKLDARKCISYLTIEYKGELPESEKEKFHDWIFGCDICQEVCPWNRFAKPTQIEEFRPSEELKSMDKEKWHALDKEQFQKLFKGSAVKRTKFEGLRRNIDFLAGEK